MEKIIATSQTQQKEDATRLRNGDLEDIDHDLSWVKKPDSVRHFGSQGLLSVYKAAEWVRAKAVTNGRAQQEEQATRERLLLLRLGQSFDCEVDCCCWRLDSLPTETIQWLTNVITT
ncbi:hypothetical protein FMUND_15497 [Fusarium mundagurra]|uniref:Uncharacterized protein n=1 Tax=Fusarium mundagurra TaxID=1567541 RepID=A0A8H5XPE1_9HYPO|nr:hypothetical protein FMUND_15497 [Fusarium mundagurra]